MHHSLGDGLLDGGGTVTGCANCTTVFCGRFWLAVVDMLVPFTCLWPCPHVKGKWVKPWETIESLRQSSIAFADALDSKSCAYSPYKYSMSQWTRQWWLLFNCTSHSSWNTDVSMENHLSYAQWGSGIRTWCCIQSSNPALDFVPISSLAALLSHHTGSIQRLPKLIFKLYWMEAMDMMWLSLGTLSFFAPVLSWMTQCLSYIFPPLDSQVMSSHALSYQSMMPVHAPQVNATKMVVVSINALCVGPVVGLPDSPSSTLLPPSLAGWLWPFATEHSSFCHWLLPKHLSFILLCATYLLESICLGM
jgi:hypothetical protein